MLTYFLFVLGFVALIKGADLLVDGASSLANRLGVSALVIGLTIVAFGTSAPELVVNLLASVQGNTDLAIANILGSNIANILLILGTAAVIYPLSVGQGTVWKEIPFAFLAVILLAFLANDAVVNGGASSLDRTDGWVLLGFFAVFLYYIYKLARQGKSDTEEELADEIKSRSAVTSTVMILFGLAGLAVGGTWIVDGAVSIAYMFGISEALVGLTIVAVGTSLPELATSVAAALKKNADIAVGNVVGSNIFNILWILGISAFIRPLPFSEDLMFDLIFTVLVTSALFLALFVGKRNLLERWQGWAFLGLYLLYILYLVLRG